MGADSDPGVRASSPSAIGTIPTDLVVIIGFVVLAVLSVVLPGIRETPIPMILGLPFVLFVPGFALIAIIFPEAGTDGTNDGDNLDKDTDVEQDSIVSSSTSAINGIERIALSLVTSIAIVVLFGLVLKFTPWGIQLLTIFISVGGFTLIAALVGAQRREALDPEDRFVVPYETALGRVREELLEPDTRADLALNILLVVSLLVVVGGAGYAVTVPQESGSFTEFYILTENETGELVAGEYPDEFVTGESNPLIVGINNQEYETTSYTAVVQIQRVQIENGTATVEESEMLQQFSPTLEHNETWQQRHQVAPTMTGERLRLTYLLYEGDPPSNPTTENAYREVHLWVNVAES